MENDNNILDEEPIKKEKQDAPSHPLVAFIIGSAMVFMLFGLTLASILATDIKIDTNISLISTCIEQIMASVIIFGLSAFTISRLASKQTMQFFNATELPKAKPVLILIAILFCANFFLNLIIDLNELIPLTENLTLAFEKMQNQTIAFQEAILNFSNVQEFALVFLTMAIVPAFVEEHFFRGLLQGSLLKYGANYHIAVFASSILFGLVHFQFYNFFALVFMGLVLGYAYYYTKNLWVPIVGHLFNNGLIVILTGLNKMGWINIDIEAEAPLYISIIFIIIFCGLSFLFLQNSTKEKVLSE